MAGLSRGWYGGLPERDICLGIILSPLRHRRPGGCYVVFLPHALALA